MKRLAALLAFALVGADSPDIKIPAEFGLVEGIAWDGRSRQLFAGNVEDGSLLVQEGDHWRRAVLPYRTAGLFGMAVDPRRGILWISGGVAAPTKEKAGFRGLIGVTALGLQAAGKASVPAADGNAQPGDVAIAPDGTVYVSDGATGAVYQCRPDCTELVRLVPAGTFESAQGLAVSRDGTRLYVADYGRGLFAVALKKTKGATLVSPIKGMDGLVRDGDALIAIVNGGSKEVLRLTLDPAGATVTGQDVLARPSGPGDPTLGTIVQNRLLYVADAQWDRFDDAGRAKAPARVTTIGSLSLPAGPRPPEFRGKARRDEGFDTQR